MACDRRLFEWKGEGQVKRILVALAAVTALALGACGGASSGGTAPSGVTSGATAAASGPMTVTDALGRKVSFPAPPKRIVIAGKSLFMISDAAYMFPEASARVVAVGTGVQYKLDFLPAIDPAYGSKTALGKDTGVEQIVAAKPDAVFLKTFSAPTLGKPLEAMGIKVVYFDLETPDAYTREITELGRLFGDPARAQQLNAMFAARVAKVASAVAGATTKPRVLVIYYSDKNGTVAFNVSPKSWINTSEVQLAGGLPVWLDAQLGQGWTPVSMEQIAAWNPDQVYVITYFTDPKLTVAKLKADPRWKPLKAVQSNAVYAFPGDYYSWDQPDPRWLLGLTWLASKVHPEKFIGLNLDTEARSFYSDLYGLGSAAYDAEIKPNLWGDLP
jgi:iron complex transport system substrate-binding protein